MRQGKLFRQVLVIILVLTIGTMTIRTISACESSFPKSSDDSDDWEHLTKLKRQQSDPLYFDDNHSFSLEFTHIVYLKRLPGGVWQPESDRPSLTQNYTSFQITHNGHMETILPFQTEWELNSRSNLLKLTLSYQMRYAGIIKEIRFSSLFNASLFEFSTEQVEKNVPNPLLDLTVIMGGTVCVGVLWIFWRKKK